MRWQSEPSLVHVFWLVNVTTALILDGLQDTRWSVHDDYRSLILYFTKSCPFRAVRWQNGVNVAACRNFL